MNIRSTTDPISLHDIRSPETHPCVYLGDGDNGVEVFFESEENRRRFLEMELDRDDGIAVTGSDSEEYVAEG